MPFGIGANPKPSPEAANVMMLNIVTFLHTKCITYTQLPHTYILLLLYYCKDTHVDGSTEVVDVRNEDIFFAII